MTAWRQALPALLAAVFVCAAQGQPASPGTAPPRDDYRVVGALAGEAPLGGHAGSAQALEAQPLAAQDIFRFTNQERTAEGLAPLGWSPELCAAAQQHALRMAANGALSHQYAGERDLAARASQSGAHFSTVAENIALGADARQVSQEWMRSPPHRANILDPRLNTLGVAVVVSGGRLYAVQDFAVSMPALTAEAVEDKVASELQALSLPAGADGSPAALSLLSREEARSSCALADGLPSGSKARFVLRWEGPELALPKPLRDAAQSGRYAAASVGACAASGSANRHFTLYRVAVLLY